LNNEVIKKEVFFMALTIDVDVDALRRRADAALAVVLREERGAPAPARISSYRRERRFCPAEVRTEKAADKIFISGYAAAFGQRSADLGGWFEIIHHQAFDQSLRAGGDVTCTIGHDQRALLGRLSSGTLRLSTDTKGLHFKCEIAERTQAGNDVLELVRRQDLSGCSFGFVCLKDSWADVREDGKLVRIRTLLEAVVTDVGPCVQPAYPVGTSVAVDDAMQRSLLFPDGLPNELRHQIALPQRFDSLSLAGTSASSARHYFAAQAGLTRPEISRCQSRYALMNRISRANSTPAEVTSHDAPETIIEKQRSAPLSEQESDAWLQLATRFWI
jgi:uncharacterized protein